MSFAQTVLLAGFAGVTIYLGLPVGRLRNLSANWQALLTAAAGGVILFLIFDVLARPSSQPRAPSRRPGRALQPGPSSLMRQCSPRASPSASCR